MRQYVAGSEIERLDDLRGISLRTAETPKPPLCVPNGFPPGNPRQDPPSILFPLPLLFRPIHLILSSPIRSSWQRGLMDSIWHDSGIDRQLEPVVSRIIKQQVPNLLINIALLQHNHGDKG